MTMANSRALIPGKGDGVESFFGRCGLSPDVRHECHALIRRLFPGEHIDEVEQGYCSYTLSVGQDKVLQFRPPPHRLDVSLAEAARTLYGDLAPETQLVSVLEPRGLLSWRIRECHSNGYDEGVVLHDDQSSPGPFDVISMTRIPGISLAELRASSLRNASSSAQHKRQRESIVGQFASFIASGWAHGRPASDPVVSRLRGKVGGSIEWRLSQMNAHLEERFQLEVRRVLGRLNEITSLPWVFTHGDVVAANVMVQPPQESSSDIVLTGFLDWAEAEYLPFGVGLYGLEELLGQTGASGQFAYYSDEAELRELFWDRLEAELPEVELKVGRDFRIVLEDAHILGVLLWHGIAFDDGKLDRVVEEGRDDEEIRRLELFLRCQKRYYLRQSGLRDNL